MSTMQLNNQSKHSVVFIGEPNVGKTCIINKMVRDMSILQYDLTGKFTRENLSYTNTQGTTINYQLYDCPGQLYQSSIAKKYFRNASVIVAVYDTTCRQSFLKLKENITQVLRLVQKRPYVILVGNKIDQITELNHRQITQQQVHQFCYDAKKCCDMETSIFINETIEELKKRIVQTLMLINRNVSLSIKTDNRKSNRICAR